MQKHVNTVLLSLYVQAHSLGMQDLHCILHLHLSYQSEMEKWSMVSIYAVVYEFMYHLTKGDESELALIH